MDIEEVRDDKRFREVVILCVASTASEKGFVTAW